MFLVLSGLFLVYLRVYKEDQWSPTLKYFWDETLNTKRKVLFKALPWLCIQWCNYRLGENNRFLVLLNVQYYNKKSFQLSFKNTMVSYCWHGIFTLSISFLQKCHWSRTDQIFLCVDLPLLSPLIIRNYRILWLLNCRFMFHFI